MTTSTITLNNWKFKNVTESTWMDTTVPSTIHMDLFQNGCIPHPFRGTNEKDLQWIDKEDWEYKTFFSIDDTFYNQDSITATFHGLDTITSIFINEERIFNTDNMFRVYEIDIKPYIKIGENTLNIVFHSPIKYGLEQLKQSEYILPATMDDSEMGGINDKKVSMYIRKAPYHFGWDWGPRFATSGIWRDVSIKAWSNIEIKDIYVHQKEIASDQAVVDVIADIHSTVKQTVTYQIEVEGQSISKELHLKKGENSLNESISINDPKLWWTHDLGDQNMTTFSLDIISEDGKNYSKKVRTGLRSIELVQEDDEKGTTFYFKLNGIPLFIKGANHIPLDSFIPEIRDERYFTEVSHAYEANMNMLRVWGGGIYEENVFYELCDAFGILVWQDFMFSCSMYPGTEVFLENVAQEAEDNIKRLRNHPSIALWCGNNEIDSMWKEFSDQTHLKWKEAYTPEIRAKVWKAYDDIFHKLLPNKIKKLMPEVDYWPSSPMAELSYSETQHATLNTSKGDIHLWNVWHSGKSIETYNDYVGRFMSEYGFQSFPHLETMESVAEGEVLTIDSEIVNYHQKNKSGNLILNRYLENYYKEPKDFEGYTYLSQTLQGYAFETAIRAHRREMPYCMGTLYWQLNDVWPGASWSTIDYYGNKKLSHYRVKDAYKETILAFHNKDNQVDIYGVTDALEDKKLTIKTILYSLKEKQIINEEAEEVIITAQNSALVKSINKHEKFDKLYRKHIILYAYLIDQNHQVIDTYGISFESLKNIELNKPKIDFQVQRKGKEIHYILESDTFTKSVKLHNSLKGDFKDNGFDLFPGFKKQIIFKLDESVVDSDSVDDTQLKIKSMYDFVVD